MIRIALIHALAHSVAPINEVLTREWPEARRMNLLDDSLSSDLARSAHGLDEGMHLRFEALAAYAEGAGAQAILFTCSAFGPCIEVVARQRPHMPVLRPNEAMVDEAASAGGRIGLVASFAPTLVSLPREFPAEIDLRTALAEGALASLDAGDAVAHDACVVLAAEALAKQGCTVIALTQFSMARAQQAVERAVGLPVLTTPGSAVRALRRRLMSRNDRG